MRRHLLVDPLLLKLLVISASLPSLSDEVPYTLSHHIDARYIVDAL
jgi:hypothetical protein